MDTTTPATRAADVFSQIAALAAAGTITERQASLLVSIDTARRQLLDQLFQLEQLTQAATAQIRAGYRVDFDHAQALTEPSQTAARLNGLVEGALFGGIPRDVLTSITSIAI